jgi:heat shock protein HtpX
MRRVGLRLLMAGVGFAVLVFYALAAAVAYWALVLFWVNRPPLTQALVIVGGMTLLFGYLSYQFGTTQLLRGLDAVEIPRDRAPQLYDRVEDLSASMAIQPPRLLVADLALPNALALGSARNGVVVVDRSLFRLLTRSEFDAIIAHELAHLESRDSLVQTLAFSAMRTVVGLLTLALLPLLLFVTGIARGLAWIRGRPTTWSQSALGRFRGLVESGVAVVFLLLTLLVRAHSRRREFAADDRAAEVTGQPVALARALGKIERVSDPDWGLLTPLYTRGDEQGTLTRILSTHPATDERIDRLLDRADHQRQPPRRTT